MSLLLVVRPGAPCSFLLLLARMLPFVTSSDALAPSTVASWIICGKSACEERIGFLSLCQECASVRGNFDQPPHPCHL